MKAITFVLITLLAPWVWAIEAMEDADLGQVNGGDGISLAVTNVASRSQDYDFDGSGPNPSTASYSSVWFYDSSSSGARQTGLKGSNSLMPFNADGTSSKVFTIGNLSDPITIDTVRKTDGNSSQQTAEYLQITLPTKTASYSNVSTQSDLNVLCKTTDTSSAPCYGDTDGDGKTDSFFFRSITKGIRDDTNSLGSSNAITSTNIKIASGTLNASITNYDNGSGTFDTTKSAKTGVDSDGLRFEVQLGNLLIDSMEQRFGTSGATAPEDIATINFNAKNFQLGRLYAVDSNNTSAGLQSYQPLNVRFACWTSDADSSPATCAEDSTNTYTHYSGIQIFMNAPRFTPTDAYKNVAGSGFSYEQVQYVGSGGNCDDYVCGGASSNYSGTTNGDKYNTLGKSYISNVDIQFLDAKISLY